MRHHPITRLSIAALWFPLWMVLFEFSTYIANDMIMPGMLGVVTDFQVGSVWVPTALSVFLLGGASIQWYLGPLSDRVGRRPVMLVGVAIFVLASIAICLSQSIEQFMTVRFVQGMGLCFISAVGYAAIQEAFDEKTAIQVTALMLNVSMIAPLIGPLAGSAVLTYSNWQGIFLIVASLAMAAGIGLYFAMPETSARTQRSLSLPSLWRGYRGVLFNPLFMLGTVAYTLGWMPILSWIAESPVFIMETAHGTTLQYGLWQLPVMGSVIVGSLALAVLGRRLATTKIIVYGAVVLVAGVIAALGLSLWFDVPYQGMAWGLAVYATGLGFCNAALYRITLFSSDRPTGLVSAAFGIISLLLFSFGVEVYKSIYAQWGVTGFATCNLGFAALYVFFLVLFLRRYTVNPSA